MSAASTCRPGSAWHTWQRHGQDWAAGNPGASPEQAEQAAQNFASAAACPAIGREHMRRAFLEGALNT